MNEDKNCLPRCPLTFCIANLHMQKFYIDLGPDKYAYGPALHAIFLCKTKDTLARAIGFVYKIPYVACALGRMREPSKCILHTHRLYARFASAFGQARDDKLIYVVYHLSQNSGIQRISNDKVS